MTADQALLFAFDWPWELFLLPVCCTCGVGVRHGRLMEHMDTEHPGWLETWNAALRENGVTQ